MELEKEIIDIDKLYYLDENVLEKMNDYYLKKKEYDDKLKKNKRKDKPKCIFCDKVGGTIFKTEIDKGGRALTAKCGNKLEPCLNEIIINIGKIELFSDKIKQLKINIEETKKKIIYYKNDLLFGYIDKISPIFDELKFDIEKNTLRLHYIQEHYIDRVENPDEYDKLIDLEKLIYENINEIKLLLANYESIPSVMEIYKDSLLPSLHKTLHLKYFEPEVIYEEDDNCYRLLEIPKKYKTICNEFSEIPISESVIIKKPKKKPKIKEIKEIKTAQDDEPREKITFSNSGIDDELKEEEELQDSLEDDGVNDGEEEMKIVPFQKISFEKERVVEDEENDDDMPELEEVNIDDMLELEEVNIDDKLEE